MERLGEPSAILAHEILVQDAYVPKYLFCGRGLVLSITEPLKHRSTFQIVRCRGLQPLDNPEQHGSEFYQAFEDEVDW